MWLTVKNDQIVLSIIAKPNAAKNALIGIVDDSLVISLKAKPHKGEANKALVNYLSTLLKIPKSQIIFHKGESSKYKKVLLPFSEPLQKLLVTISTNLKTGL